MNIKGEKEFKKNNFTCVKEVKAGEPFILLREIDNEDAPVYIKLYCQDESNIIDGVSYYEIVDLKSGILMNISSDSKIYKTNPSYILTS